MKINTDAMNRCYELMGRLDPDHWDIDTDGNLLTVKLRRMSSLEMYIQFKGDKSIKVCKTNAVGRLISSDTLNNPDVTPMELRRCLTEIWGKEIHIPEFNRKFLK